MRRAVVNSREATTVKPPEWRLTTQNIMLNDVGYWKKDQLLKFSMNSFSFWGFCAHVEYSLLASMFAIDTFKSCDWFSSFVFSYLTRTFSLYKYLLLQDINYFPFTFSTKSASGANYCRPRRARRVVTKPIFFLLVPNARWPTALWSITATSWCGATN